LRRVFAIQVLVCPRCGGPRRISARDGVDAVRRPWRRSGSPAGRPRGARSRPPAPPLKSPTTGRRHPRLSAGSAGRSATTASGSGRRGDRGGLPRGRFTWPTAGAGDDPLSPRSLQAGPQFASAHPAAQRTVQGAQCSVQVAQHRDSQTVQCDLTIPSQGHCPGYVQPPGGTELPAPCETGTEVISVSTKTAARRLT
jgi:hypothetical protein